MLVDHFCHYVNCVIYVSVGLSKAGRRQVGVYEQEEWEGSGDRWKWTSRKNGRGQETGGSGRAGGMGGVRRQVEVDEQEEWEGSQYVHI